MPIHIAITRRVRPGYETEFQQALRQFFQASFAHGGVLGATVIVPPPDSDSREFGIVRKFANREALTVFRTSPEYLEWNQLAMELTEGSGRVEELCGLESWFTFPGEPLQLLPKWKMAIVEIEARFLLTRVLRVGVSPNYKGKQESDSGFCLQQ